jgi:hypothetical protein
MLVRRRLGVTSVSDACSIGRKGPTSLPDGLSTPSVAAISRTTKLVLPANTAPATAMSRAPTMRVRRRPIRSAFVVRKRLISVSPTRVRVSRTPIDPASSPAAARYRTRITPRAPYPNIRTARARNSSRASRVTGRV